MADPIQINLYIKSLGLTGKEADLKRKELENLTTEELNLLISGKKSAAETPTWGLDNLKNKENYSGEKIFSFKNDYGIMGWETEKSSSTKTETEEKTYTPQEKLELRKFAGEFIYNSTANAKNDIESFNKSIGFISLHNGVNNFKSLIGSETSHELENRLSSELEKAETLRDYAVHEGKFEYRFEKDRKISFNPKNIEELKAKSEEYTRLTAFQEKYDRLQEGLKHVRTVYATDMALEQARERGQIIPARKENFEEEFIKVLDEFCSGDTNIRNAYIKKCSEGITNKKELNAQFLTCLEKLEKDCKTSLDRELGGKSFAQHTKEYDALCRKAIGSEDAEQMAANYIENAKKYAAYAEIGVTIAASLLLPGSGVISSAGSRMAASLGQKAAGQILKAGMTTTMASVPAAITTIDAVTSENGLTSEKKAEIIAKWKNGLLYGGLGAYVSGPIGNSVEALLKTKPTIITGAVQKAFNGKGLNAAAKAGGITAETSADVVLDMITQNGDIISSLQTNGGMNIGMMIAGGRLSKAFRNNNHDMNVQKNIDGSYSLKDGSGRLIFKASDENILATFLLGRALENSGTEIPKAAAGNATMNMPNPGKNAAQKLQDKVGLKISKENPQKGFPAAPMKYNAPDKEFLNVLKHLNPEIMEAHYAQIGNRIDEVIKNHSSELKELSKNFALNKQTFAEKVVNILSNEFGLKGLEPPVRFGNTGSNDGYWDWNNAELLINKDINDPADALKMLSHEFQHVIQYKNILTKYGEEGLMQLCKTGKTPQKDFEHTISLPYTQKLLQYVKENPHAKNGLDDYMSRIYTDEMIDYKDSDNPEYPKQLVENEAYYLGNNRSNRAYQEYINKNDDAALSNVIARFRQKIQNGEDLNLTSQSKTDVNQRYTIDEYGQIHRNTPAGKKDLDNPLKSAAKFASENGISSHMLKKYIELGKITLTPEGKIDSSNPDNIKFIEEINRPSLITKEELSEMLGIAPERLSSMVRSGQLIQDISNKYDIENEQNKAFIEKRLNLQNENITTRGALGKTLGINIHSVDYHIQQGHLKLNADGKIDLTDELNKKFVENFQKGERQKKEKVIEPVTDKNIQSILGKLPLEYCIRHKLLIADENGKINYDAEPNKTFVEKFRNKELSVKDYFVSVAEFARRNENTETTIIRAITNGKIEIDEEGRIDVNSSVNKEYSRVNREKKYNPNLKTITEIADMLGYSNGTGLNYHLKNNRLVRESNGMIDITKEPNKSFIESILNGTYEKQRQSKQKTPQQNTTEDNNAVYRTQKEIAEEKGITQATLAFHLAKGHLVSSGRGKIDLNNPVNDYFMKTFKKGEKFIPYEDTLPKPPKTKEVKPETLEEVNPNMVTLTEFAALTGLTNTPVIYHMNKGRIVRGEDGKFDLSNPLNRRFIQKYTDAAKAKYETMTTKELEQEKTNLQNKILPFIGRETYINAQEIQKISAEDFDSYISYTARKIINTEGFTDLQLDSLTDIFKEIITKRINDKSLPSDFSDINLIALSSKCEIPNSSKLLERLSEPVEAARELKFEETDKGFEIQIEADEAFDELISNIQSDYGAKINIIKTMQNTEKYPSSKLTEAYLYNRFLGLKLKGDNALADFMRFTPSKGHNPIAIDKINIENFVENILYKDKKVPQNDADFEKFKKHFDTKKIAESIEEIKSLYRKNFYKKVCTEDTLNMLQDANPYVPVSRENLIAVVNEKLGIESAPDKTKHLIETAKYKDRRGRRTPVENEIKEYIEAFHSVKTIKTYNELVQLYNRYCGVNKNDKIAGELLEDLKMTDVDGEFNKESILLNEDIIKDIIKKYEKYADINKAAEVSSLKASYNEYEFIIDEVKELMENAGIPARDGITPENLKQAKLFMGIIEKYAESVDIENINASLKSLSENFKGKLSDIAEIYDAEPVENKSEFITSLTGSNGIQNINKKLELYNRWKHNIPEDFDINSYEYFSLTNNMKLTPEQIYSTRTNLFEVLGVENYDGLESFLSSNVQGKSANKARIIYETFGQKDVDGLRNYLDEHNIDYFKIKSSIITKPAGIKSSNHSNSASKYHNVILSFKNKDKTVSQSFNEICEIFENINGKVTLKEGDTSAYTDTSPKSIISELTKRVSHNTQKNAIFNNPAEYQNIFRLLDIDTENMTSNEIAYRLNNLTAKQEETLQKISSVLSLEEFDKTISSLHCKMRFLERFMLNDGVDINNRMECAAYINYFNNTIQNSLNNNVMIEVFQSGTDGSIIAPKFKITDNERVYTITLNDKQKIHTIF